MMHRLMAFSVGFRPSLLLVCAASSFWLAPAVARAQDIDLVPSVSVHQQSGGGVRVVASVQNASQLGANQLRLSLWPILHAPVAVPASLQPGETIQREWHVSDADWKASYRGIAAIRLTYTDAGGRAVSRVAAAGPAAAVEARAPVWPASLEFTLTRTEAAAGDLRVTWWTPSQLGVIGDEAWPSATTSLRARVSPSSQIDGWRSHVIAILVPDDESDASFAVIPIDARVARPLWQPPHLTIALWSLLVLGGTVVLVRRVGVSLPDAIPGAAFLLIAGALALSLVPPALVALSTTPGGGDYASHFVAFEYLRHRLLPSGVLYGWFPGHYAGMPLFLMYFPLIFWLASAMSLALPLAVAFKAATFAGPLLLPAAWFLSMKWLGSTAPARWLAATAAVVFLINEPQQVWGGNLASVLAGEFAQGLGFPLAWITVAWAWSHRDVPKGATAAGVLLAVTTLAHAYSGVAAAVGIALLVLDRTRWWARLVFAAWTAIVAAGLLTWWLMPLLWHVPWTTPAREIWPVDWHVLVPATTLPLISLALVGLIRLVWRVSRERQHHEPALGLLFAYAAAMAIVAQLAYSVGVVNIRFWPVFLGACLLAGSWEAGRWIDRLRPTARAAALTVTVLALSGFAITQVRYLPHWVRWNMRGIEYAPGWRDYSAIISLLPPGSRVFYEHSPDHDQLGTPRAFELLPLLASSGSLEGLYQQSALLAPSVFYLQSELSERPSCAVSSFECGRLNIDTGVTHARLLGADIILAYSRRVTDALDRQAGVTRLDRVNDYTLYRVEGHGLASPSVYASVTMPLDDWRYRGHDWWRAARDLDVPLVARKASAGGAAVTRYEPGALPRQPLDPPPTVSVAIDGGTITLATTRPGHPVFVRVAYHPGWRADDGSLVELAAPGIMLVTPRTAVVHLSWSAGLIGRVGAVISVLAVLFILIADARRLPASLSQRWRVESSRRWGVAFVGGVIVMMLTAGVWVWRRFPPVEAAVLLGEAQSRLAVKDFQAAERLFMQVRRGQRPMHDDADFFLGLTAAESGDAATARARWEAFLVAHPVSTYTAEVMVRLARIERGDGNFHAAEARLRQAIDVPLAPEEWREAARAELSRSEAGPRQEP